jgi:hypothetical protein
MPSQLHLKAAVAGVALTLALTVAGASGALAQSAQGPSEAQLQQLYHTGENIGFNAPQDHAIAAARSAQTVPMTAAQQQTLASEYRTGAENSFDPGLTNRPVLAQRDYGARVASTVPTVGGKRDLIGDHGAQDALANQIYQPGSRPPGW